MKIRYISGLFLALTFLLNTTAAQNPNKISWSVVAGGQLSDMNYGLSVVESLIAKPSAFINYGASGKPATGWFAGAGAVYPINKSVQMGVDVTYSLNRYSIEGENSDIRSNAPILSPPGYPIRLQAHAVFLCRYRHLWSVFY